MAPPLYNAVRNGHQHIVLAMAVGMALLKHHSATISVCYHGKEPLSCALASKLHHGP